MRRLSAVILLCLALASACGGSDTKPAAEPTPTSAAPAATATTAPATAAPTATSAIRPLANTAVAATPTTAPAPTPTTPPAPTATATRPAAPPPTPTATPRPANCSLAYPTVCIPPPPPDLDCKDITPRRFRVLPPDPHRFDSDGDGIGCES